MGFIRRLDSHLTNMIAAGEVVERPMGVVKELVENAIDANATSIDVTIVEGGIHLISVKDNGNGMDGEDATMAFQRHSTSKISKEEDLWSIASLGFRGEALPSIASVSECECITSNGIQSTKVKTQYGKLIEAIPYESEKGTTINVKGLFLKTPARLKHMKTLPYEQALIVDVMQRFTISYPTIAFSLQIDEKIVMSTNGSGNLQEVIYRLYGADIARESIPFKENDSDFVIHGLLIKPSISRATRKDMFVFTNQRMVRSSRIQRAIMDGYRHFMPSDRYPIVFLFIEVDLKLIDVNVHPSKWEVRLSKEAQLLNLIEKTIGQTLTDTPQIPRVRAMTTSYDKKLVNEHTSLFDQSTPTQTEPEIQVSEAAVSDITYDVSSKEFRVLAQLHKKYILAENEEGLYIFDQHASMERIRYEHFKKKMLQKIHHQVPLLIPITITHKRALQQANDLITLLHAFQITAEYLQQDTLIIRSVPEWLSTTDTQKAIDDIVDYFDAQHNKTEEDLRKKVLSSLACHSSVRFNDALSNSEMQKIIHDLMLCEQPYHCPHGRPTYIQITTNDLFKEFLR